MVAIQFKEKPTSRPFSAKDKTKVFEYTCLGIFDENTVANYAASLTAPLVLSPVGILYRQDIRVTPGGHLAYHVTVPYGERKNESGSLSFSFDTTGGTVRIYSGKSHAASFPNEAPPEHDPHKGLIGVHGENVDGVDIAIPALKLTYSFRHPLGVVTESLARQLARMTGKTNSDVFRGFRPGEMLFLGATGSDGTDTEASVDYHFAASENFEGETIAGIANVNKAGHDYLWLEWEPAVVGDKPALQASRVHVETVYAETSFAAAFGWN